MALCAALVLFMPGDVGTKMRAGGLLSVIVIGFSFIAVPRTNPRSSRSDIFRAAASREGGELPAIARIDTNRPVLAVGTREPTETIYLIVFLDEEPGGVLLVSAVKKGKPPAALEYASILEARVAIKQMGARVLPQSEFTDNASEDLFGDLRDI